MLWSFGRVGFQDETLMDVMHDVAEKLANSCDRWTGRGAAGVGVGVESRRLWAVERAGAARCWRLPLQPPSSHVQHHPTPLPPPPAHSTSLADVVYAEAQMGWADQRLAELVADYATANIETFDATSLTRLLAGLASVGCAGGGRAGAGIGIAAQVLRPSCTAGVWGRARLQRPRPSPLPPPTCQRPQPKRAAATKTLSSTPFVVNTHARAALQPNRHSYDDDDLAEAAANHACQLLEAGDMTPSQLVPLMWAYGLQVRGRAPVLGRQGLQGCGGAPLLRQGLFQRPPGCSVEWSPPPPPPPTNPQQTASRRAHPPRDSLYLA
jgi:hypothetical protein